jgi:hypothetical protein
MSGSGDYSVRLRALEPDMATHMAAHATPRWRPAGVFWGRLISQTAEPEKADVGGLALVTLLMQLRAPCPIQRGWRLEVGNRCFSVLAVSRGVHPDADEITAQEATE